MEKITTNTKSFELTGEEIHIHFATAFPYFWVRNDSGGTVLMSLFPNIEEGGDGVIEVLAGSSAGTMHGFNDTRSDLYLSGSGKVQVMGTHSPENPFRNAGKGGGDTNKILPYSEGLAACFDCQKGASNGQWTDIVGGIIIENAEIQDDSVVLLKSATLSQLQMTYTYTFYAIVKSMVDSTNLWLSVIDNNQESYRFGLGSNNNKFFVTRGTLGGAGLTGVSDKEYHICTMVFNQGVGRLYIDGKLQNTYENYINPNSKPYFLSKERNFKFVAFFDKAIHSVEQILENTQYLAQKYGIQI